MPLKSRALLASEFCNCAVGREVPAEDRQVARLLDRVAQRPNYLLAREFELWHVLVILREGLTRDRELRAVDQVRILQQVLDQRRDASDFVQVFHHVITRRPTNKASVKLVGCGKANAEHALEVTEVRRLIPDGLEVVNGELDVRRARHREQVQHRVGGAADDVDDSDSVQERLASEDVPMQCDQLIKRGTPRADIAHRGFKSSSRSFFMYFAAL